MKLISFAIPSYNSQDYMEHCIESLLPGGEDVEIIIVDDGSKDRTAQIADMYAEKYPTIVKAIHQENGGHGEAVNTGLKNATGVYYKVVDSDDWADEAAYKEVLKTLKALYEEEKVVDMFVCNFIYDKAGEKHKKVMNYRTAFPRNQIFGWKDVRHFHVGQYILMHSVFYRTRMLKDCGLCLPKHTFYVDNIFVFDPLPFVKQLYYLDVNFYHYFIGRQDQSVNEQVMIGRIDQQLKVNKLIIEKMEKYRKLDIPWKLKNYLYNYTDVMNAVSSALLLRAGNEEALGKKEALWFFLKEKPMLMYLRLRWSLLGVLLNLPGSAGRKISVTLYKMAQKLFGFN